MHTHAYFIRKLCMVREEQFPVAYTVYIGLLQGK